MGSTRRGAVISKNDNGTLERVDGSSTYVGTTTMPSGKVLTKRFRSSSRNDEEVTERWLKWQHKENDDSSEEDIFEETEEKPVSPINPAPSIAVEKPATGLLCPFMSGIGNAVCRKNLCACWSEAHRACSQHLGGIGLYNIATNLMNLKIDEPLELIAMAIGDIPRTVSDSASTPTSSPAKKDGVNEFLNGKNFMDFVNLHSKGVSSEYRKFCAAEGFEPVKEKDLVDAVGKRFPEIECRGVTGGTKFLYKG